MRLFRNVAIGLTLALLAFAISFAILTYGPRRYTVAHNHYAEEALWNGHEPVSDGEVGRIRAL